MKLLIAGLLTASAICAAQSTPTPQPKGQVIFSRSIDENGQTTQTAPAGVQPSIETTATPSASDAERNAVTFTGFDMDVRLRPSEQHIAVRALITVRNDGKSPLTHIPLQISSSLNWEQIRLGGKAIAFQVASLNSDVDHTGQLHEAAVPLVQPLAPGQSIQFDVTYSGTIAPSAQRLLAIGTPEEAALHSDWDKIGAEFTGLRGFGNVVWYPVSSVPVMLGDGARLFDAIGEHKLHLVGAHFRLRLTVEFLHDQAPTVALINGHSLPLSITEPNGLDQAQEVSGVATTSLDGATLGFEAPSLFVAIRTSHPGANLTAWTLPENNVSAQFWSEAATAVTPFLQSWLGQTPRSQLTLLDLPDPQDAPFETGSLLAASMHEEKPALLDGILVHAFTHAWLHTAANAPPAWMDEGAAHFMGTLWTEKQSGQIQALGALESGREALALAEPDSPGESVGQPLATAISPVYYRTKAAYIFWMLRDLTSDETLSAALKAYDPTQVSGNEKEKNPFQKLLEKSGAKRDLTWFFADWVDADKGLPDLTIDGVFPRVTTPGSWLVAVNLANNGYAAAEFPVTVRSEEKSVTQRILVPARSKATQRILIQGKPIEAQVNDGTIPETQASIHLVHLDKPEDTPSSSSQSAAPQP